MSLYTAFDFNEADLEANRNGRLSDRQRQRMMPAAKQSGGGAISGLPLVITAGVVGATGWLARRSLSTDQLTQYQPYLLAGAAAVLLFVAWLSAASRRRQRQAAGKMGQAVQEGAVRSVSGQAEAGYGQEYEPGSDALRDEYRLVIGGRALEPHWSAGWNEEIFGVFEPATEYRAYYIDLRHPAGFRVSTVLSVERA